MKTQALLPFGLPIVDCDMLKGKYHSVTPVPTLAPTKSTCNAEVGLTDCIGLTTEAGEGGEVTLTADAEEEVGRMLAVIVAANSEVGEDWLFAFRVDAEVAEN